MNRNRGTHVDLHWIFRHRPQDMREQSSALEEKEAAEKEKTRMATPIEAVPCEEKETEQQSTRKPDASLKRNNSKDSQGCRQERHQNIADDFDRGYESEGHDCQSIGIQTSPAFGLKP
jgi:flagellar biosynthesis/type III secretory pathway protein FliH